jgi:uncharacterized protein involved in tolerance to divalent cations
VLRLDEITARNNKKFSASLSERMYQFSEELTQIKTLDQETSKLLKYLEFVSQNKTPEIKILNLEDGLIVEQHANKKGRL